MGDFDIIVEPLKSFPPEWERPTHYQQLFGGNISQAVFGDDSTVSAKFYLRPIIDEAATLAKGVKIVKQVEYCEIRGLGNKFLIWDSEVRHKDKIRFPNQYAAFKADKNQKVGIPLELWDYNLSPNEIMTLKLLGISFVHELAVLADEQLDAIGIDGQNMRARARVTITDEMQKNQAGALQSKFDDAQKQIDKLREENTQIMKLLSIKADERGKREDSLQSEFEKALDAVEVVEPKRRPGRPRKIQ